MRSSVRYLSFWLASSLPIFFLLNWLPGDAASFFIDLQSTKEHAEIIRDSLGLNEPLLIRYVKWVATLGLNQNSLIYGTPVWSVLSEAFARSMIIGALALAASFTIGMAVGIYAALLRAGNFMALAQVAYAVPAFVLALILVSLIPAATNSMVAAAICLSVGQGGLLAWSAYEETKCVLKQEYVFLAFKRKSIPVYKIVYRHIAPHVAIGLIGIMSLQFAFLMSGTVIVEKPFGITGLGSVLLHALNTRDVSVLQTGVWFIMGVVLLSRYVSELIIDLLRRE